MIIICEYCTRDVKLSKKDILTVKNGGYLLKTCKCAALIRVHRNEKTPYLCITQSYGSQTFKNFSSLPEQKTSFAGLKVSLTYILTFLWVVSVATILFQPFYSHAVNPVWLNASLFFFIIMTYLRFYR